MASRLLMMYPIQRRLNGSCPGDVQYSEQSIGANYAKKNSSESLLFPIIWQNMVNASVHILATNSPVHFGFSLGPNGELIHNCKCCTQFFGSKEEARIHRVEVHGHKLNCDLCQKTLKTPESRRYHMQSQHGCDGPVHICSKCGKWWMLQQMCDIYFTELMLANVLQARSLCSDQP